MLDKQEDMHACVCTRLRAEAHARTEVCNIYCFSTAKMIRERASVLRYTSQCYVIRTLLVLFFYVEHTM